ncbi:MAG: hypothetical protein AABY07_07735 [Nanoarchaeota archaeon]
MKYRLIILIIISLILLIKFTLASDKIIQINLLMEVTDKGIRTIEEIDLEGNKLEIKYPEFKDFKVSLTNLVVRDKNSLSILEPGLASNYKFKIEVLSKTNSLLKSFEIAPSFFMSNGILLESIDQEIVLEYSNDIKYLKVYYNNEEKLSIDLEKELCNKDNICVGYENYLSCPTDCDISAKDNLCNEYALGCDLDCYHDRDCLLERTYIPKEKDYQSICYVIITLIIMVIALFLINRFKKK